MATAKDLVDQIGMRTDDGTGAGAGVGVGVGPGGSSAAIGTRCLALTSVSLHGSDGGGNAGLEQLRLPGPLRLGIRRGDLGRCLAALGVAGDRVQRLEDVVDLGGIRRVAVVVRCHPLGQLRHPFDGEADHVGDGARAGQWWRERRLLVIGGGGDR